MLRDLKRRAVRRAAPSACRPSSLRLPFSGAVPGRRADGLRCPSLPCRSGNRLFGGRLAGRENHDDERYTGSTRRARRRSRDARGDLGDPAGDGREHQETARLQRETDRLQQENAREQREIAREQRENARQMRETDRRLKRAEHLFTTQWGKLMESLVAGDLVALLEEWGIAVEGISQRIRKRRNGRHCEVDILALNGEGSRRRRGQDDSAAQRRQALPGEALRIRGVVSRVPRTPALRSHGVSRRRRFGGEARRPHGPVRHPRHRQQRQHRQSAGLQAPDLLGAAGLIPRTAPAR